MATLPLTAKQEQLWRFIGSCRLSPSLREMQAEMGMKSRSQITTLLNSLVSRGFVSRIPGRARAVIAVDGSAFAFTPSLDAYPDADLIAELERRSQAALARPKTPMSTPKTSHGLYGDWRVKARIATDQLLTAIEQAGVRP